MGSSRRDPSFLQTDLLPGQQPFPEQPVAHLAGIPIAGAVPNLVGQLIVKQTQLDLILDQIRTIHRKIGTQCGCGQYRSSCRTWPVIEAYDKARKEAESA